MMSPLRIVRVNKRECQRQHCTGCRQWSCLWPAIDNYRSLGLGPRPPWRSTAQPAAVQPMQTAEQASAPALTELPPNGHEFFGTINNINGDMHFRSAIVGAANRIFKARTTLDVWSAAAVTT